MRRTLGIVFLILTLGILSACNSGTENEDSPVLDELKLLGVEFIVPEHADVGEKVVLKAMVTYGEDNVIDADEVSFEYWVKGNEENSTTIDADNNGDGMYTSEVVFDHDGVYEIYAHTTAKSMHAMPKKSITIGEGAEMDHEDEHQEYAGSHEHDSHADGFGMHFMKPEEVKVNQNIDLTVHLQLDNHPLTIAHVRYEIYSDSNSEKHDWVDAEEIAIGEYTSSYSFAEKGLYTIVIHVENDEGLHEHGEQKVEVSK